jgi:hypothetical protein
MNAEVLGQTGQFTVALTRTYGAIVFGIRQQKLHDIATYGKQARGMGLDHHPIGGRKGATRVQTLVTFHFDKAKAARSCGCGSTG